MQPLGPAACRCRLCFAARARVQEADGPECVSFMQWESVFCTRVRVSQRMTRSMSGQVTEEHIEGELLESVRVRLPDSLDQVRRPTKSPQMQIFVTPVLEGRCGDVMASCSAQAAGSSHLGSCSDACVLWERSRRWT